MATSEHGPGVRSEKVNGRTPDMCAFRKSDGNIIPKKQANKEGLSSAESVEGRTSTKRNTGQMSTVRTQGREAVSRRLASVRQAARGLTLNTQGRSHMRESHHVRICAGGAG